MKHYLIFAGTTEGRELIEYLYPSPNIEITACTATEYGKVLLPEKQNVRIISHRLDYDDMVTLMKSENFDVVCDTTHPYAVMVSQNVSAAAEKSDIPYLRVIRPEENISEYDHVIYVDSMSDAVSFLSQTDGNILCTTGSKELSSMCHLSDYSNRVYARILPNPQMVSKCVQMGFSGKHLICMQGPFSQEMNTALIHQFDIKYLLTKSSGKIGGFPEKVNSAKETGITLVVIGRPTTEKGITLEKAKELLFL